MAKRGEDRYTNLASADVTESAANTITYQELLTGISLGVGVGMLIDQLDYLPAGGALDDLVAVGDQLSFGWFTSNSPTSIELNDRRLIHMGRLKSEPVVGTAASGGSPVSLPLVYQFFPAMIVAAPRIYFAVLGDSLAAAARVQSRLYFRYIELSTQEYLELAEAFILVG